MRQTSDQLCREYGLSVIEAPEQGRTMSYDTWEAEQKGKPTWYGQIRQDVDSCITRSFLFEHFISNLRKQGYEVKLGKYIAVRPPGKERFVRLKTLGNHYTEDTIKRRIRAHEQTPLYKRPPAPPKQHYRLRDKPKKITGFRALYYHYLYWLRKWRVPTAPPRKRRYNMAEIIKFDRYQEQFKFLVKYKIDTTDQLAMLAEAAQHEIEVLTAQRKQLYYQKRKDPENKILLSSIESINQSIKLRRREVKLCAQIEADTPNIREKQHALPSPRREQEKNHPARRRTRTHQR